MTGTTVLPDFDTVIERVKGCCAADRVAAIGICGPGGTGKSTLCRRILQELPAVARHLDCDLFSAFSYLERQHRIEAAIASGDPMRRAREENPLFWYDWDGIGQAVRSLRASRSFTLDRAWNRETGMLDATYTVSLPEEGPALVLCDCIYLLHDPVRRWFDATLLLQANHEQIEERGRRRAQNTATARYMERLAATYTVPYFSAHAAHADYVHSPTPAR